MKSTISTLLKYLLSTGLAVGLFWYLYRDQPVDELLKTFSQINHQWVLLSGAIYLLSHWGRAARWKIMLEPVGYSPKTSYLFYAVMVGYLANLAVPRMGEVTRCGIVNKTSGVPVNVSFGAVIAERIFDLLMLMIVATVVFFLEFDKIGNFILDSFSQKSGESNNTKLLIISSLGIIGFLCLSAIWFFRQQLRQWELYKKIEHFALGLKDGVLGVLKLNKTKLFWFLFYTVLIWTCYCFTSYYLFFTLPETSFLGLDCGLAILLMSAVAVVIPAPAGSAGVYHYFIGITLTIYGVKAPYDMQLPLLMHTVQTLFIMVAGSLALLASLVVPKENLR
jgi:uncharacterized protein (TIRG00374 family)